MDSEQAQFVFVIVVGTVFIVITIFVNASRKRKLDDPNYNSVVYLNQLRENAIYKRMVYTFCVLFGKAEIYRKIIKSSVALMKLSKRQVQL
jgi:hypothetical protein